MNARYRISNTPSVDDVLVYATATGGSADKQADESVWTVVRVNYNTGRGTVQHVATRTKLQIVRGRFGWSLANGSATPVRFATRVNTRYEPVAVVVAEVIQNDLVICAVEDIDSHQLVGTVQRPVGDPDTWTAAQIYSGASWPTAQQAADALVAQGRRKDAEAAKRPHHYGDPCQTCGEPAYDYNISICADCRRERDHDGRDPLSRLYTPGKARVLAQLRDTLSDDDEDPDNDPCDRCEQLCSPLYLVDGLCPACQNSSGWEEKMPGYTYLVQDGRIRGYVEHDTLTAFWNYAPASVNSAQFTSAIAPSGTYTSLDEAKINLIWYVAEKDAICDGTRGIQGVHLGCDPAVCKS